MSLGNKESLEYLMEIIKLLWLNDTAHECQTLEVFSWTHAHRVQVELTVRNQNPT